MNLWPFNEFSCQELNKAQNFCWIVKWQQNKQVQHFSDNINRICFSSLTGLLHLLKEEVYIDSFILHNDIDETEQKTNESIKSSEEKNSSSDSKSETYGDSRYSRRVISNAWLIFWKFQPLWKIRNYFGEKVAFYFAWTGMLMTSLWIPTIFGIIIFCYGLNLR